MWIISVWERVIFIYLLDVILVNYLLRCHNLIVVFYPMVPSYGAVESDAEPEFEPKGSAPMDV